LNLSDVLNQIIDDGIEAARADYTKPSQKLKLEGSIKGFEDCRGKAPAEIVALMVEANERAYKAMRDKEPTEHYWYWRCRAAEVEWVVLTSTRGLGVSMDKSGSHFPRQME
jgi:hypothetical protein